mmetsp:Transcript_10911/g.28334  ORF Transcript_10911/g.28334 Transcript_10911/m.28334 type:complete len:281 (-) Transcript_10911:150-992(-)
MHGLSNAACTGKTSPSLASTSTTWRRGRSSSARMRAVVASVAVSSKRVLGCRCPSRASSLTSTRGATSVSVPAPTNPRKTCGGATTMEGSSSSSPPPSGAAASGACWGSTLVTRRTRSTWLEPPSAGTQMLRSSLTETTCEKSARARRALSAAPSMMGGGASPGGALSSQHSANMAASGRAPASGAHGTKPYRSCAHTRRLRACASVSTMLSSASSSDARAVSTQSPPGRRMYAVPSRASVAGETTHDLRSRNSGAGGGQSSIISTFSPIVACALSGEAP